ncbi:MAG TPA: DUF3147 family protein [Nitrososphaerales archaeon]|nr:DUF3147 family protein [Nitrososphaerales archaeon]
MTIDLLLLRLILAFVVGSVWVTLVTIIAERAGSSIGGFVGGLPSISVFSFLFIGLNQSPEVASQATTVFPLILSFSGLFALFYALLARRGFALGLSCSFVIWFALDATVVVFRFQSYAASIAAFAVISIVTYLVFERQLDLPNFQGTQIHYTVGQILFRALLAGSVVVLAVLMSEIGGPIFGGIFSAFPAVFTSTLYIMNKSRGLDYSRAITKPLMISATLTSAPYSVTVRYTYPALGVVAGTLVSYALVIPFAVLSYYLSKRNNRTTTIEASNMDTE